MSNGPNPTVLGRRLRSELRSARSNAYLTQGQVATEMEWSISKVIRIENGTSGISKNDLEALLRLYHIDDARHVDELVSLAKVARQGSWWDRYRGVLSDGFVNLIEYEESASVIRNFQPLVVPGLLQTPEYARAVIAQLVGEAPARAKDLIDVRLRRQEVLDRPNPPMLWSLVDEGVVRRLVGGPQVMRRQILHIIDAAARANVSFEILPFSAGFHPAMTASFVVLEFPDAADDDALYIEDASGGATNRESKTAVESYTDAFEELRKLSLGPVESLNYLSKLADEMT